MTSSDGHAASPASREPARDPAPDAGPAGAWTRPLTAALAGLSLAALLVITVVPLGATRVFAWPWTAVYAAALAGPACLLLLRAFDPRAPLVMPGWPWQAAGAGIAAVVLASAAASPYRGPALLWAAPELAAAAVFFLVFDWLHAGPGRPRCGAPFARGF